MASGLNLLCFPSAILDFVEFRLHIILRPAQRRQKYEDSYLDGLGNPLAFMLSSGADHDSTHAVPLLQQINIKGGNILGDKAYGPKAIRTYITSQDASYTIPPCEKCDTPWPVDWYTYKERHLVECFFQKLKWFRRIFTRYDKLDSSFLAFVYIGAISILLK